MSITKIVLAIVLAEAVIAAFHLALIASMR